MIPPRSHLPQDTIQRRFLEVTCEDDTHQVTFVDRRGRATAHTYRQVGQRAADFARGLMELGLAPGERVAIILPTGVEFLDALFGTLLAGGVPTPLYPPVRLGRIDDYHRSTATMIRTSGARFVVSDRRVSRILGRTVQGLPEKISGLRQVDELRRLGSRSGVPWPTVTAGDLALVQFSSGTTAAPKAVALGHEQILWNCEQVSMAILGAHPEIEGEHRCVSWLPLYHDMGLIGCVLNSALAPRDLVLLPPEAFVARPQLWLETISRYGGTVSAAPNFAYAYAADRIPDDALSGIDLSRWVLALNGAEPVTPEAMGRFVERFEPAGFRASALCPVYGLAEATLAVTFSSLLTEPRPVVFERRALERDGLARRAESPEGGLPLIHAGRPLAGTEVTIRHDDGTPTGSGRVGEIFVRGPSVMDGYLGDREATDRALTDGWLRTGDRGFRFEGDLFIFGRSKDVIIIGGRNRAPQGIEETVSAVEGVRPGCVVAGGKHFDGHGEGLAVFVERDTRAPRPDEELHRSIDMAILDRHGLRASQITLLAPGTLPRTSSGKLRRRHTLELEARGALKAPGQVTAFFLLKEMARSRWAMRKGTP